MTWLKRIGQWIVAGIKIEMGIAPIFQGLYPQAGPVIQKVESEIASLMGIIVTAEAFGSTVGLPGADKVRVAAPLIQQMIQQSAFMIGKPIADPVANAKAAQTIAGGLADWLNSLKEPPNPTTGN